MSEEEKLRQLGKVLTDYQAAKVELAHLEKKLQGVEATYTDVADFLKESAAGKTHRIKFEEGHLRNIFAMGKSLDGLLNETELLQVLNERHNAQELVASLLTELRKFGITNVE